VVRPLAWRAVALPSGAVRLAVVLETGRFRATTDVSMMEPRSGAVVTASGRTYALAVPPATAGDYATELRSWNLLQSPDGEDKSAWLWDRIKPA
jgi:hypothetical protein